MLTIDPAEVPHSKIHQLLLGSIGPRPIAFASTVDRDGNPNLSPFSFFNVFGVNPTTLIFSPSRRSRDNTTKHTFENVKVVPEVVINVVTYDMVNQVSLASSEFPREIDEFIKAGFTRLASEKVKPFRVKESPVQLECKVREIIETGHEGGAGNLVICEVLVMHVNEEILSEDGLIDQQKIRLVGRMGKEWYCKAFGDGIFQVAKPLGKPGMGIDGLPDSIRLSRHLTGNELGILGNLERLPDKVEIEEFRQLPEIKSLLEGHSDPESVLLELARKLLQERKGFDALKVLML